MVLRGYFNFETVVLAIALFGIAVSNHAQASSCNEQLRSAIESAIGNAPDASVDDVLDSANADIWRSIRSSKTYKPISNFLLSVDSPVAPVLDSEPVSGVGVLRLTTDLRTGSSTLERLDPRMDRATGASETVLDTHTLPRANAWGRVESVSLSKDHKNLLISYRNYGEGMAPFEVIQRPMSSLSHFSVAETEGATEKPLIRNYKMVGSDLRTEEGIYELRNYGLNASTDLVLIGSDGTEKLIDSSFAQETNGRTKILNVVVSPNQNFLVVQSIRDGSIDHYQLKIYNRHSGKFERTLETGSDQIGWEDGSTLSYQTYSETDHGQITSLNLNETPKPLVLAPQETSPTIPDLQTAVTQIGDGLFYFAKSDTDDLGSFKMIKQGATVAKTLYPGDGHLVMDGTFRQGDYVFLKLKAGGDRVRKIFNSEGQEIGELTVPSCCSMTGIKWIEPGKTLALQFSSVVPGKTDVTYDLATKAFDPPDFAKGLMTTEDGVTYTSEVVNIKSSDGTLVPMRISHRRDLINDGTHASYMEVYGGFGNENPGFVPVFDPIKYQFMKDGGVLVSPAIRGGNEFGEKWHLAGSKLNKIKTYEDTAAAAQYLIDHKISAAKKIIVTGASNGGLVSAEVGLMYPDLFGLVIPENGPYDLADSEVLDARAQGAKREYGSNAVPAELQNKIDYSPLEKAKSPPANTPPFFIVSGRSDSRVNPEHSARFFQALKKNSAHPETVQLLGAPFSGHWNYSSYDGIVGWSTESAIWTKIYDFMGMRFHP